MPAKMTHEEYVEKVKVKNPNIEILSTYEGSDKPIKKKCLVCGTVSEVQARTLLISKGCVQCGIVKSTKAKMRLEEDVLKEINDFNPNIDFLSKYTGVDNKIKCRCKLHNIEYEATPCSLKKHISCPECIRIMRHARTDDEFKKELKERYPTIQSLSKFTGTDKPTKFKCTVCGYEWTAQPNRLLNVNKDECGCPRCKGKHYKITEDDLRERISKASPNTEYISGFIHVADKAIFKCKVCGYEWESLVGNILGGTGCPKCKMSKGEIKIGQYLDAHNIKYRTQHIFDDCKNKYTLRFDFYLPEFNCCIEYDGIQHFKYCTFGAKNRTAEELVVIQERDKIKDEYCKEKSIDLIRIPYTDFDNIEKILDKYFSQILRKRVFGIAGRVGILDTKGTPTVYQNSDDNAERIHLLAKNMTFGWAFTKPENFTKITFSA